MIGQRISHYQVLTKIGAGGMGVVYKATDLKLERTVALKFLPSYSLVGEAEKTRFLREAKAAALLHHPNICTVFEIDEAGDQAFISMAYIEGKTLQQIVQTGPLHLRKAVDITIQVATGLQAAHAKHVIHRDIKSANVVVSPEGHAVVMDFGLAKLGGDTRLTKPGAAVGTVSYMSPEQTRGEDVDHRTDIWSLGVVLYELVTGRLPFRGEHETAVVYAIVSEEPEPVTAVRTGVPLSLERIINKALAKNPSARYQHADELIVDLRAVRGELEAGGTARRAPAGAGRRRFRVLATAAVVLVAALLLWWRVRPSNQAAGLLSSAADSTRYTIAVLPLDNLSGDDTQEYFADGMTEAIITELAQISGLRVISRTSVMRFKNSQRPLTAIARELNAGTILEGSVVLASGRVRINAQLIDGGTDEHLWAKSYEGDLRDVVGLQGTVALAVADEIEVELSSVERNRLASGQTVDPAAYELYLRARYAWNRRSPDSIQKGMEYFSQAIEKDPDYALAYAGLAQAHLALSTWAFVPASETMPKAREMAFKALQIDASVAEAYATLGAVAKDYDWKWSEAESHFKRALDLNPSYATAHQWYGEFLSAVGRHEEALVQVRMAQQLDPLSLMINTAVGFQLFFAGDIDGAVAELRKVVDLDPTFSPAPAILHMIYDLEGMNDAAVAEFLTYVRLVGGGEEGVLAIQKAYETAGMPGFYQARLAALHALSARQYVSPFYIAAHYARLAERDSAFQWLEKAVEERAFPVGEMATHPALASLRSDPRFHALLERMGLASILATPNRF